MPDPVRKSISATQASALVDASPYMTRWMLWRWLKYGEEVHGHEHNRMDWGKRMEAICLAAAAEDLFFEVIPTRQPDGTQPYVRRGLLGCTRDAKIICPDRGPGALETKCVFDTQVWAEKWGKGKTIPREIEIQLQVQMFTGDGDGTPPYKWGVVSAWFQAEQFYFERKPIPELEELLRAEAAQMFADVEADNEPPATGSPLELALLSKAFPTVEKMVLDYTDKPDSMPRAERVRLMQWHSAERLGHERAEKQIKAELLALAEGAETINFPYGIRADVKTIKRAGYTVKPSSYQTVNVYVPANLPDTIVEDLAGASLGG